MAGLKKTNKPDAFELSQEDLQSLLAFGLEKNFAKGKEVFLEGDKVHYLWVVKTGRVHLVKSGSGGSESLVAHFGPGKTFCAAAVLVAQPYLVSARAALDSVLIAIPAERFLDLVAKLPSFAKRLLNEMAPQFCVAHCECAMNIESVDRRLAHTLLRLDGHFQGKAIPFKRSELAQMVNTTSESCIRKLSAWTKVGWVGGARGEVKVLNRTALKEILDAE